MPVNSVARSELSFASGPFVVANKLARFCCAKGISAWIELASALRLASPVSET